jgi:POT family proton-dependent oligopeptide transporter
MDELKGEGDLLLRDATQEEIDSLVHETAEVPLTAWLLSFTGAASQFARFGITVAWRTSIYLSTSIKQEI